MYYGEITEKALEMGWVSTKGKTPKYTMYAVMHEEIKRSKLRGVRPKFVKVGEGFFGLSKWEPLGIEGEIEKHNRKIRKELHRKLFEMDWEKFENLIDTLFVKMGFETDSTPPTSDGGVDVRGTLLIGGVVRIRMAVQVKRWKHNVRAPTIQQLRGSLGAHEQGLIVTTSDFSKGARKEAEKEDRSPVALMNGEELVFLLVENEIGVQRKSYDLIKPVVELRAE